MHTLGKRIATLFLLDRPVQPRPAPEHERRERHGLRDALALANAARPLRARDPGVHSPKAQYSNQAST